MANVADNTHVFAQGMPSMEHCSKLRVGIVAAEWNDNIIAPLLQGAVDTLVENGVQLNNIYVSRVPGTVELTYGARCMMETLRPDAVIVLGHFDYVCDSVTQGVTELNLLAGSRIPVIFGVITTNTMEQAADRAGGKVGNKGSECAATALKMAALTSCSLGGEEFSLLK